MIKFKRKLWRHGTSFCAGSLTLLLLAILACPNFSSVSAQDAPDSATGTATTTEIYVKSNISITTQEKLDFEVTPNSDQATFNSKMTTVSVSTNNQTGYGLYLHTTSADGKLRSRDSSVTQTINPLTQDAAPASSAFASNSWGYSTNNATYKAIPIVGTPSTAIISTSAAAQDKTHNVYIGAKIGVDLPVGFYTGDVVFSAVANPVTVHGLQDLTYMQDMTPKVCEITPEGTSKGLIDRRDSKTYSVAKMKDGNCWMQSNLMYNLGKEMTSTDTDLAPGAKVTLPTTAASSYAVSDNNDGRESRSYNSYNYYQWRAATADSGTLATVKTSGQEAPDSICPKGWQLPLAGVLANGANTNGLSGSFYSLLKAYNVTDYASMTTKGMQPPLSFSQPGFFWTDGLHVPNAAGAYWSRVASSATGAYQLWWYTGRSEMNASSPSDRYYGLLIRCVARRVAR